MEDEELEFQSGTKARSAKQGRRARNTPALEDPPEENIVSPPPQKDGPPDRPSKAVSGWGEDNHKRGRSRQLGEGFELFEDERLRPQTPGEDSDSEIPVIPELEEQQDEDMTIKVAVAPNIAVNRVATYRELDNDLLRQAAFLTLDNDIDLKLLTKAISPEQDLVEEDRTWDWDRLFTEVTSELITETDKEDQKEIEAVNELV